VKGGRPPVLPWVSAEQAEFYDVACQFAGKLDDGVIARDADGIFWREAWERCAEFGVQGLPVPEAHGGGGADVVTTMLGLEALGYGCTDNGLVFSINAHMWTSEIPIWVYGTPEQQERWLPGLCDGTRIGCHTISEPDAGSDAFAMTTRATAVEAGYLLSGRKTFITNAPLADLFIAFARTSEGVGPFGITAFLVETGTPGCDVQTPVEKLGLRTSPMADVVFEECYVPKEAVLGVVGRGGEIFQTSMRWERACIMASQVGSMRRTMERCVEYAQQRRQFGKPIGKFESVADKIANMKISLEASRGLVLRTGWLMDNGHDATVDAAVAKAFVSEANVRTHLDAVQIHGGYGYMTEFEIERSLRDAVGGTIYSGTSEIQRRIIARGLGL
jgi:alkylation response protein AidB-like acyl-CoA dehydrogenase